MSRTLILWLPPAAALADGTAARPAWLRVDDGVIVDSGQDDGWVDAWERPQDDAADDRLIALAPAADVPLRWHHYPDAAPAQAAAAARLDALKDSLGDAAALHVVAGQPAEAQTPPDRRTRRIRRRSTSRLSATPAAPHEENVGSRSRSARIPGNGLLKPELRRPVRGA